MDPLGSEPVPLLVGIAAIVLEWLWLSAGNEDSGKKVSRMPLNDARRSLTFRISNIPQKEMDQDKFRDLLVKLLATVGDTDSEPKFSYSPSAVSSQAGRYAVATASFEHAPTVSELETFIKREIGFKADRLTVDLNFFGLTPLTNFIQDITVDIIAVTGLAGHAFGSWKSKNKPDMWLRDFLPKTVPNARILTYGYDTKLPGSQSEASIPDLSRKLLESIKTVRSGDTNNRPLILLGHSLGGLVVKEALAQAFEGSENDKAVFNSCFSVLLFAVPNRGLDQKSLMSMVKGQPNEDLINDLKQSSRFLKMLGERFNKYYTLEDSSVISIYETKMTRTVQWSPTTASWERTGPEVMMVPFTSAMNASLNETSHDQLSINADHSEIVKFSDESDSDYNMIESRIKELVDKAPRVIQERLSKLRKKLSESEKLYINALKAPDYAFFRDNKVSEPTPGTLNWFLENELVRQWLTNPQPSALWVQGSPGQGKTILAKFLLAHLESSRCSHRTAVIYFFFYNQDDICQTVSAALRSFIKQLLSVPDAFQVISNKFNLDTSTITDESIWAILEELLCSSIFDTIYCVVDALDECQDPEARQRLLALIKKLVQPPLIKRGEKFATFKAFLTSRPTVDLSRNLQQISTIRLKASPEDLKIFISSKIQDIGLAVELQPKAIDLLSSRVEQTFLWISIILKRLRTTTTMLSEADMERIIGESPSDLTDLYESITSQIMQSDDEATKKLLIWTVFSRRPLTLLELEDALAIQETSNSIKSLERYRIPNFKENTITSAAGIILEIIDKRVYLIHQSAKEFLLKSEHLTKATFCKGLQPGIYLAKICMTFLCFTDFIEAVPCRDSAQQTEKNNRHPFLQYAARNWHRHIKIDDNFNDFDIIIGRLTKPGSPELLAWGELARITNLDTAKSTWDVATIANIPWLAEFQSRGSLIEENMIEEAIKHGYTGYNFMKSLTGKSSFHLSEGAIHAAVKHFDHETIRQLLNKDASIVITSALIEAAASNRKYGRLVIDSLLEFQDSFVVTERFIQLAAENDISGKEIMEMILHKDNTNIPEGAMAEVAAKFDIEMMRMLVNLREDIKITEKVMKALMEREHDRTEMIMFLLEQGQIFQITEEVIQTIAANFDVEAMKLVFEKQSHDFWITEEVIKAATRNWRDGNTVMAWLLDQRADFVIITEETVSIIAENFDKKVMTLLLSRRGNDITITEKIVNAAAMNQEKSIEVITTLLKQRGDEVVITMKAIQAVTWGSERGQELMPLLLNWRGNHMTMTEEDIATIIVGLDVEVLKIFLDLQGVKITITENLIKTIAKFSAYPDQKLIFLLNRPGASMIVTEDVLCSIAAEFRKNTMEFLLKQQGNAVTITQNIITATAGNESYGEEVIKLLLDQRGIEFTITEEVVVAAVRDPKFMALLLDRRGDEITITQNVMKAAAEKSGEVVKLLLDRRGAEIIVTEEVVIAATRDRTIMELLLDRRGVEIIITEEVMKAAAANSYSVVKLLLDRRGAEIIITEEIMNAAATYGASMIGYLLNRRGHEITITERIMVTAARGYNGDEMVKLLLDQRGTEITITDKILIAAASNNYDSKKTMQLFLDRRRNEITITEEVIKAAATTDNDKVLDLISDRVNLPFDWSSWRKISKFYNAARNGDINCLEQLIHEGINPDMKNNYGVTPLHIAVANKYEEAVKVLAQRADVDVNSISANGETPLFWPSYVGDEQIVTILLEYGADPYIADNKGQTAITIAKENGHYAIARMLAQAKRNDN